MSKKITAIIASTLLFINVIFWCSLLFILTPVKFILPEIVVRKVMDPIFIQPLLHDIQEIGRAHV